MPKSRGLREIQILCFSQQIMQSVLFSTYFFLAKRVMISEEIVCGIGKISLTVDYAIKLVKNEYSNRAYKYLL